MSDETIDNDGLNKIYQNVLDKNPFLGCASSSGAIINVLRRRKGFSPWWDSIEMGDLLDIKAEISDIVRKEVEPLKNHNKILRSLVEGIAISKDAIDLDGIKAACAAALLATEAPYTKEQMAKPWNPNSLDAIASNHVAKRPKMVRYVIQEPMDWTPYSPPFHYDSDIHQVVDTLGHSILEVPKGFLVGINGFEMEPGDLSSTEDRILRQLADLMNA